MLYILFDCPCELVLANMKGPVSSNLSLQWSLNRTHGNSRGNFQPGDPEPSLEKKIKLHSIPAAGEL